MEAEHRRRNGDTHAVTNRITDKAKNNRQRINKTLFISQQRLRGCVYTERVDGIEWNMERREIEVVSAVVD